MDDLTAKPRTTGAPVAVRPLDLPPLQTLRLFRPDEDQVDAASARLGFELPLLPLRLTRGSPAAARLAPDEWLIRTSSAAVIAAALAGVLHHVCEARPGRAGWRIDGPAAGELIAGACSIDLHPALFPEGACVRTLFAQVGVILSRPHDGEGFELLAGRPAERYLAAWLDDAVLGLAP